MAIAFTKAQRFAEFVRRLLAAEPASSMEGGIQLIADTLNAVEDELTSIPFTPTAWQSDGRMYPPMADARRRIPGRVDVVRYRSVAHNTFVGDNGAVRIEETDGTCRVNKPGRDGRTIEL